MMLIEFDIQVTFLSYQFMLNNDIQIYGVLHMYTVVKQILYTVKD